MPADVIVALIGVLVALIGAAAIVLNSIINFIGHVRNERIEREKVKIEREKVQIEIDRIKTDQQEKTKKTDSNKAEAEIYRTNQERFPKDDSSKKLSDIRQVVNLINIFEQTSISSTSYQDPFDIYLSVRKTRSVLEESGIILFNDKYMDDCFRDLKQIIQDIEVQVRNRCHQINDFVIELENRPISVESQRLKRLSELSNQMNCSEVIKYIMEKHDEILKQIPKIQKRAEELRDQKD